MANRAKTKEMGQKEPLKNHKFEAYLTSIQPLDVSVVYVTPTGRSTGTRGQVMVIAAD